VRCRARRTSRASRSWRAGSPRGTLQWSLIGAHNVENALAAIAAARHVGVEVPQALDALQAFQGIARRLQLYGEVKQHPHLR